MPSKRTASKKAAAAAAAAEATTSEVMDTPQPDVTEVVENNVTMDKLNNTVTTIDIKTPASSGDVNDDMTSTEEAKDCGTPAAYDGTETDDRENICQRRKQDASNKRRYTIESDESDGGDDVDHIFDPNGQHTHDSNIMNDEQQRAKKAKKKLADEALAESMKTNQTYQSTLPLQEQFLSYGSTPPTLTTPHSTPTKKTDASVKSVPSPVTPSLGASTSRTPSIAKDKKTIFPYEFQNKLSVNTSKAVAVVNMKNNYLTGRLEEVLSKEVPHFDSGTEKKKTIFSFSFVGPDGTKLKAEAWGSPVADNQNAEAKNKILQLFRKAEENDNTICESNALVVIKVDEPSVKVKLADPKYDFPAKLKLYINDTRSIWFKRLPYIDTNFVKSHGDPRVWGQTVDSDVDDLLS